MHVKMSSKCRSVWTKRLKAINNIQCAMSMAERYITVEIPMFANRKKQHTKYVLLLKFLQGQLAECVVNIFRFVFIHFFSLFYFVYVELKTSTYWGYANESNTTNRFDRIANVLAFSSFRWSKFPLIQAFSKLRPTLECIKVKIRWKHIWQPNAQWEICP